MKVINIHQRVIQAPKPDVLRLFATLATRNDQFWPVEHWPRMKFKDGVQIGASGGHGPIRYVIEKYDTDGYISFRFLQPTGFNGMHWLEINAINDHSTEVRHTIDMRLSGMGLLTWPLAIKQLHDALLEDALDKVENQLTGARKRTRWNLWVQFLRKILG
jgi:hypothetical protein